MTVHSRFDLWGHSILLDMAVRGGDVVQDPAQVISIVSKNPYSTKPTVFERNIPFSYPTMTTIAQTGSIHIGSHWISVRHPNC